MKRCLRIEERLFGARNVIGRRLYNTLALAGGDVKSIISNRHVLHPNPNYVRGRVSVFQVLAPIVTITRLPNRNTMKLLGSDGNPVTSTYGMLFEGKTDDGTHVVVKAPKIDKLNPAKWAREIETAQKFGAANIGPRVLLANANRSRAFMIMEKVGLDLLEHLNLVFEKRPSREDLKHEGARISSAVDSLISNIATNNPTKNTCFGDFRFENILIDKVDEETYRALQIDFDFCFSVPKEVDLVTLLRLAVTFSQRAQNAEVMKDLFPPVGRMFGNELWKDRKRVKTQLGTIKKHMNPDSFENLASKMFDTSRSGSDFVETLERYYDADTQKEAEKLFTGRTSPNSVTDVY